MKQVLALLDWFILIYFFIPDKVIFAKIFFFFQKVFFQKTVQFRSNYLDSSYVCGKHKQLSNLILSFNEKLEIRSVKDVSKKILFKC